MTGMQGSIKTGGADVPRGSGRERRGGFGALGHARAPFDGRLSAGSVLQGTDVHAEKISGVPTGMGGTRGGLAWMIPQHLGNDHPGDV